MGQVNKHFRDFIFISGFSIVNSNKLFKHILTRELLLLDLVGDESLYIRRRAMTIHFPNVALCSNTQTKS